jgi:hypothetical protein
MLNNLICNNMYKDMWAQFQTKRMTGLPGHILSHLLSLFSFRSTSCFVFVQPHFPALELGPRFGPLFTTSAVAKDKPIWPTICSNMFQRFSEMRTLQVVPQWFQLVPIGSNCWYKCSVKTNFDFQQWQFLWQLVNHQDAGAHETSVVDKALLGTTSQLLAQSIGGNHIS